MHDLKVLELVLLWFFPQVSVTSVREQADKPREIAKQHCVNSKATKSTAESTVIGSQSNLYSHLCTRQDDQNADWILVTGSV